MAPRTARPAAATQKSTDGRTCAATAAAATALEARLADLERTDSTQIAVLTVPSLEGGEIGPRREVPAGAARHDVRLEGKRVSLFYTALSGRAGACTECGACLPKCPQKIPISEWMVQLEEILGQGMDVEACLTAMA